MWKELLLNYAKDNPFIILNSSANAEDILEVENILNLKLPAEIKELLSEVNGDNNFLFSTKQIIETNIMMQGLYNSLSTILFVATNGCGDYYGYPVSDKEINNIHIYGWNHESNKLVLKANNLEGAIEGYYTDSI